MWIQINSVVTIKCLQMQVCVMCKWHSSHKLPPSHISRTGRRGENILFKCVGGARQTDDSFIRPDETPKRPLWWGTPPVLRIRLCAHCFPPRFNHTSYRLAVCSAVFRPWYIWMMQTLALLWEGNQLLFTKSMTITWFFNSVLNVFIWKVRCTAVSVGRAMHPFWWVFVGIPECRMILGILWLQLVSLEDTIFFV